MPPPRRLHRGVPLVLAVVALASCSSLEGRAQPKASSDLPTPASVVRGRFVTTVSLEGGELVVQPPGRAKPGLSLAAAAAMFRAADVVEGTFDFSLVGLGVVTLSPPGSSPATTEPLYPSTGGPSGAGAGATTSLRASSATSAVVTTTTAAAPVPGVSGVAAEATSTSTASGAVPALPSYDGRLAWVGMAWSPSCPGPAHDTTGSAAPEHPGGAARYTVVLFDARTGQDAVAFTSSGPASCGGPDLPASLTVPSELVSVPWSPVGPASTAVQVSLPACAAYRGWTQLPGTGGGGVEVVAQAPFDAGCASGPTTATVDDVVPLGGQGVAHAPLGPVDAESTLAGGAG